MKTISRRIRKLEIGAGVTETAASRGGRELAEELLRRRNAWRAREGLPPERLPEPDEACRGLSLADILLQGRRKRALDMAAQAAAGPATDNAC
jgi:hypothetical protein